MEKLIVDNLSSVYNPNNPKKRNIVLRHVSFEVNSGEFFVILGRSGCGKSTLLKCIAGFQKYVGKIYKDNIDFDECETKLRDISYVTQYDRLIPNMTLFDNIAFPLKLSKTPYEQINSRVMKAAEDTNITLILSRKPRHVSLGQEQRAAIAKAIIKKSDIYLFDEPFSAQDPANKLELGNLLKQLCKKMGSATIYVTHDQDEALRLADRIMIMNDNGEVAQIGTPFDIIKRPKNEFVRDFICNEPLSREMLNK